MSLACSALAIFRNNSSIPILCAKYFSQHLENNVLNVTLHNIIMYLPFRPFQENHRYYIFSALEWSPLFNTRKCRVPPTIHYKYFSDLEGGGGGGIQAFKVSALSFNSDFLIHFEIFLARIDLIFQRYAGFRSQFLFMYLQNLNFSLKQFPKVLETFIFLFSTIIKSLPIGFPQLSFETFFLLGKITNLLGNFRLRRRHLPRSWRH